MFEAGNARATSLSQPKDIVFFFFFSSLKVSRESKRCQVDHFYPHGFPFFFSLLDYYSKIGFSSVPSPLISLSPRELVTGFSGDQSRFRFTCVRLH